jgi:hypothetical protein
MHDEILSKKLNQIEDKLNAVLSKPIHMMFCSFCNKPQKDCGLLISGNNVTICNECIALCCTIVAEKMGEAKP